MVSTVSVQVESLSHVYGVRQAIVDLSLSIEVGEVFAVLGPNGGGKTTLFRVLSTLVPPQTGSVSIFGLSLAERVSEVRCQLGVVFQSPSLDKKLSVDENLAQQGALYGLRGSLLRQRRDEALEQLGLTDRRRERAETLSGGLRRRVDLAKSLMHRPRLLLLDEPTAGLDPGARSDLWQYFRQLQRELHVTIVLTTHLLDEADRADRIAILNEGRVVALGPPAELRSQVGGDSITIEPACDPTVLLDEINQRFPWNAVVVDHSIRLSCEDGSSAVKRLMDRFADQIQSIKLGKPTLEDVFIAQTGHRFWRDRAASQSQAPMKSAGPS